MQVFVPSDRTKIKKKSVRRPGIEPGSTAWKATMLTITPATLLVFFTGGECVYVVQTQKKEEKTINK